MIGAAALAAGEVITFGFLLGPLALAALVTAAVAAIGAGIELQIAVFIAGSLASLLFLRPVAMKHMRTPPSLRSGTAALVGARAVVLERVNADGGQVKLGGEVWTARPFDEDEVMEEGARVEVLKIEGATAVVAP